MWGWISVVLFFVSHFCGDWMLHQEKRSCEKGREALQIWVSNTSTLCGKQANHRFQFSIPDPGNVEIPFEIVYISFSVQGSVIGGCALRTMSEEFCFFSASVAGLTQKFESLNYPHNFLETAFLLSFRGKFACTSSFPCFDRETNPVDLVIKCRRWLNAKP